MSRILWFSPAKAYSQGMKFVRQQYLQAKHIQPSLVFDTTIHLRVKDATVWKKVGKGWKESFNFTKLEETRKVIDEMLTRYTPRVCVVNDIAVLGAISGRDHTLFLARGSVYIYRNVPFIVVDDLKNIRGVKYGGWQFSNDLEKIHRWFTNTQRREPKFRYTVCRNKADLERAFNFLSQCIALSIDSETKNRFVTCIGYTGLAQSGEIRTFVIPFFNPRMEGGCHWQEEDDEIYAWEIVRTLHANAAVKIFQNGSYDNAYFVILGVPTSNYFLDPMHLWHSIFCELPKKINYITSITNDYNRYWKDENKGDKEDAVGRDEESLERYWRYNALDCHNTLLACMFLLRLILQLKAKGTNELWALGNYCKREFPLQVGPAFHASMTGMLIDLHRQRTRMEINNAKYRERLAAIREITGEPEFNPNSNDHFAQLLYDVLGARPLSGKGKYSKDKTARSTDEKILKHVADQHPFFDYIITRVQECKKPLNNKSKYGSPHQNDKGKWRGLYSINRRYLYAYSAGATETTRFNCKSHQLWVGNNAQNWPEAEREIIVSDKGMVFLESDYSQSDAWFIAFHSQDPDYIATMESGKDTHAIHAEHFFKRAYADIVRGNENNEEWCIHPTRGVRNLTKRIVHGCNFRMAAFTLFIQMGKESVIAAGLALGYKDAGSWDQDKCVTLCEYLIKAFVKKYKRLPTWFIEIVTEATKNGNLVRNAFGHYRLFFGNIAEDHAIQRQLTANYGQSGTAGNINRSLLKFHYESKLIESGVELRLQTHDSMLFAIPKEIIHPAAKEILTIMNEPVTINGREFRVPADAKIGLTWGKKGMIKYKPHLTYDDLILNDQKAFAGKY